MEMEATSPSNNTNLTLNNANEPSPVPQGAPQVGARENSASAQPPNSSVNHGGRTSLTEDQTLRERHSQALDRALGLTPGEERLTSPVNLTPTTTTQVMNPPQTGANVNLPPNTTTRTNPQGSVASTQATTTISMQQRHTRNANAIEEFVDETEVAALLRLFEEQFGMWLRARDYNSTAQQRGALNQAIITRDMIRSMRTEAETDELCQEWNPLQDLAELDQQETTGITDNDHVTVMPHTRSLHTPTVIMVDQATRAGTAEPPRPPPATNQFQGHGQLQRHGPQGPPQPPPPPPQSNGFRNDALMLRPAPENRFHHQNQGAAPAFQHHQQHFPPHQGQVFQAPPQHMFNPAQPAVPPFHQQPNNHHQAHQQHGNHPPQQDRRPMRRRACQDPLTRAVEVSNFMMQMEGVEGRMQRRGRRDRAPHQGHP
ncbi:hypothetical protein Pst134EA_027038 [Puccinia striiformis f. sp. tritici]|uniref:hypothetical protein n=1 Tax=Puccinia striiformis f. sp. tritici TaxID=168172 RepID=UPI002008018C|nr:hypothetical protein Pst134EA_027038 [Puccinia striiformis f. sp. tritici]KAH9450329.1 hypothetical protein Pst134EA_027038 [Puccinia striiformis f. sp. tritici]